MYAIIDKPIPIILITRSVWIGYRVVLVDFIIFGGDNHFARHMFRHTRWSIVTQVDRAEIESSGKIGKPVSRLSSKFLDDKRVSRDVLTRHTKDHLHRRRQWGELALLKNGINNSIKISTCFGALPFNEKSVAGFRAVSIKPKHDMTNKNWKISSSWLYLLPIRR